METLLQQVKVSDVLYSLAILTGLWRLGQIVSILRTGLNQHQVMWWYTAKKVGLNEDADPQTVKDRLKKRLEAKAKAAYK